MEDGYTMAVVSKPGRVELKARSIPQVRQSDVLIEVKAAAICGSDLHIFKGKHPAVELPVAIGHEISGEIVQVGEAVSELEVGDKVAVEPVVPCDVCQFCQRGKYHLCSNISFQYRQGQGGFGKYFLVHERWAHRLPEGISFEEGALIEPLSVAVHAVGKLGCQLGQTTAIFGAGAIGLFILQLAMLSGGGKTFVVDVQDHRLEKAQDLGAHVVLNNRSGTVVESVLDRTGRLGVDRAFEAVGVPQTLDQALRVLRNGGKAVLVGLFEQEQVTIPANILVQKEILLTGSQGYSWDFQKSLELVKRGVIDLRSLITHTLPFTELQQGFDILLDPSAESVKVVIRMDSD